MALRWNAVRPGSKRTPTGRSPPKADANSGKWPPPCKSVGLDFSLILSSPFLRARQTAEIVARSLKLKRRLAFSDALTPDGDPKTLIRQLSELKPAPENILLVGHEPYLSRLVALLISGGEPPRTMELKKGGLCKLETDSLRFGRCATLAWLLTPKQMKWMS